MPIADINIEINAPVYTASNGINKVGNDFRLGGSLSEDTTITTNGNDFTITHSSSRSTVFGDDGSISAYSGSANPRFVYSAIGYNGQAGVMIVATGSFASQQATLHVRGSGNLNSTYTAYWESADGTTGKTYLSDAGQLSLGATPVNVSGIKVNVQGTVYLNGVDGPNTASVIYTAADLARFGFRWATLSGGTQGRLVLQTDFTNSGPTWSNNAIEIDNATRVVTINTLLKVSGTNGFTLGNIAGFNRIQNGTSATNAFSFLTSTNNLADVYYNDSYSRSALYGATTQRNMQGLGTSPVRILAEGNDFFGSMGVFIRNSNDVSGGRISLGKSRGTTIGSYAIVQSGDILGALDFYGADGLTTMYRAAMVTGEVDGTPGVGDMPGRLVFWTSPDGSSNVMKRMTIDSAGIVMINQTVSTGEQFQVTGTSRFTSTITSGASIQSLYTSGFYLNNAGVMQSRWYQSSTNIIIDRIATTDMLWQQAGVTQMTLRGSGGNLEVLGSIKTGNPSGGTAQAIKIGSIIVGAVTLDTGNYLQIEHNGVIKKVLLGT